MKIHTFEQRSDEWYAIRRGKMTASEALKIAGAGVGKYVEGLFNEPKPHIVNVDIQRGIDLEDEARQKYEHYTNLKVDQVGFIEIDDFTGCSPDGLVGKDGGIEIKCPNDTNYEKIFMLGIGAISKRYLYQIQMNLLITGRSWWDYVAYNPNFDCEMCIYRIYPNKEIQDQIQAGINKGKELLKGVNIK